MVSKPSVLILTLKVCQNYIPENAVVPWCPNGAYWIIKGPLILHLPSLASAPEFRFREGFSGGALASAI